MKHILFAKNLFGIIQKLHFSKCTSQKMITSVNKLILICKGKKANRHILKGIQSRNFLFIPFLKLQWLSRVGGTRGAKYFNTKGVGVHLHVLASIFI